MRRAMAPAIWRAITSMPSGVSMTTIERSLSVLALGSHAFMNLPFWCPTFLMVPSTGYTYSGGASEITVHSSEIPYEYGSQYWFKITNIVTNCWIIKNIFLHRSSYYSDCIACDTEPTPTPTLTQTPTVTPTLTPSPTIAPTNTPTLAPTNTPTLAPTNTPTLTSSPTLTPMPTGTPAMTPTIPSTLTPTPTPAPTTTIDCTFIVDLSYSEITPVPTPTPTPTTTIDCAFIVDLS